MKRYAFLEATSTGKNILCINHIVTGLQEESSLHEYLPLRKFLYEIANTFSIEICHRIIDEGTFWVDIWS